MMSLEAIVAKRMSKGYTYRNTRSPVPLMVTEVAGGVA